MPESNNLKSDFQKALPKLRQASGLALVTMVTLVTAHSVIAQGIAGVPQSLLILLAAIFGDVVAGPAIEYLLNGFPDNEFESRVEKFEAHFQQEDIRTAISQLLSKQDAWMGAVGVALQYHEDQTVERILRAVAGYQDFTVAEIIQKLTETHKEAFTRLDPEIQYLTDLIANLQAHGEVWERYIRLPIEAEDISIDARVSAIESWHIPSIFSILEPTPSKEKTPIQQRKRTRLSGSIQEATNQHRRFVLIGEPGAGKTTTIRRLALEQAVTRLNNPNTAPLPMLLYLPSWSEHETLFQFIYRHWRLIADPIGLLTRGEMSLYLDGLNEMGAQGSQRAKELSEWLAKDNAPKYIIVTCREAEYSRNLDLQLPIVVIEPLDENLIRELARLYFQDDAPRFLAKILPEQGVENNERHLFHLARNPFLLTALMVVYRTSPSRNLPNNNGALIQALARALWEREWQKHTPGWISFQEMEEKFAKLAFAMIDAGMPIDVPLYYAMERLGQENYQLLLACQSANMVEIHSNTVRFYHQLIQEYFAAIELDKTGLGDKLGEPIILYEDYYDWEYLGLPIVYSDWDQVIIALSGIASDKDATISRVAESNIFLATICIVTNTDISKITVEKIQEQLYEYMLDSEGSIRLLAASSLESLGWQPHTTEDRVYFHFATHNWEGCLKEGENAIEPIIKMLRLCRDDLYIEEVARWMLAELDLSKSEILPEDFRELIIYQGEEALPQLTYMLNDWNSDVRELAAELMGEIESPNAIRHLRDALDDWSWFVQRAAAEALWRIGTPEALKSEQEWRKKEMIRNNRKK